MTNETKHTPGPWRVFYGLDTVGVWPDTSKRNSKAMAIVGPLPRTKENVARCIAFVDCDKLTKQRDELLAALEAAQPMLILAAYQARKLDDFEAAQRHSDTAEVARAAIAKCAK